jgi:hypothetical protein
MILYHFTKLCFVKNIRKQGIKPACFDDPLWPPPNHVWLSRHSDQTEFWQPDRGPIRIEIDLEATDPLLHHWASWEAKHAPEILEHWRNDTEQLYVDSDWQSFWVYGGTIPPARICSIECADPVTRRDRLTRFASIGPNVDISLEQVQTIETQYHPDKTATTTVNFIDGQIKTYPGDIRHIELLACPVVPATGGYEFIECIFESGRSPDVANLVRTPIVGWRVIDDDPMAHPICCDEVAVPGHDVFTGILAPNGMVFQQNGLRFDSLRDWAMEAIAEWKIWSAVYKPLYRST